MSELRSAGHEVLGLDRNFAGFSRRWRRVNLLDGPRVMKALLGAEAVVHLGNHPGRHGLDPPRRLMQTMPSGPGP